MAQQKQTVTNSEPMHQLLTGAQSSLYAFICSLLGGSESAHDVLQETNLVLWEKEAEYDRSRAFLPWAFGFAHKQVMAFRKKQQRDRLTFGDDLVEALAVDFMSRANDVDMRLEALDNCIGKLADSQSDLIRQVYGQSKTLSAVGQKLGKQAGAVAASLYRIRKTLSECVDRSMRSEGTA